MSNRRATRSLLPRFRTSRSARSTRRRTSCARYHRVHSIPFHIILGRAAAVWWCPPPPPPGARARASGGQLAARAPKRNVGQRTSSWRIARPEPDAAMAPRDARSHHIAINDARARARTHAHAGRGVPPRPPRAGSHHGLQLDRGAPLDVLRDRPGTVEWNGMQCPLFFGRVTQCNVVECNVLFLVVQCNAMQCSGMQCNAMQ